MAKTTAPEAAGSPPPSTFDAFPIDAPIRQALADMGYHGPTEVQAHAIGPAMAGRDLLVQSKTGSGKTSAFGIPMLAALVAGTVGKGRPFGLVLLPTRELASQVAEELTRLAAHKGSRILPVYGGVPLERQVRALESGVDVVVATPGRLLDHVRRGHVALDALTHLVLDEADEMLSMGFWDDVTDIIKRSRPERQTFLFSATLPYPVAKAATQFMKEPVRLDLSGDDLTVDGIDNRMVHVRPDSPKPRQMLYLLEGAKADSAIIFCNTRNETEMLAKYLTQSGFEAEPISGNLRQKERERTMARIKRRELKYMVATDIAARGIDITDLSHVFNYALPEFCEVYLHRVGRTGRNGKVGTAISLVDGRGLGTLSVLEKQFGIAFTEMTLPPEIEVLRARSERIMQELLEKAGMAELSQHLPVAESIVGHADASKVVAFLLKQYFNGQAAQKGRAEAPAAASADEGDEGTDEPTPRAEAGEEGEGGRRRRRRRRGRGRSGEDTGEVDAGAPASAASASPAPAAAPYVIVDAIDWLGGQEALERVAPPPRPEGRNRPPRAAAARAPEGQAAAAAPKSAPAGERAPKASKPAAAPAPEAPLPEGQSRIRVNIGFNDGFKGRGAVGKKIAALAGLNEGTLTELEGKRDHTTLRAAKDIAELVLDRVDGAQLGKKVIAVTVS